MSQAEISRFVTRALDDQDLRNQLQSRPDQAFQGFQLTEEETSAVTAADELKLQSLGIDPMTARSWMAFHATRGLDQESPELPGDLRPERF